MLLPFLLLLLLLLIMLILTFVATISIIIIITFEYSEVHGTVVTDCLYFLQVDITEQKQRSFPINSKRYCIPNHIFFLKLKKRQKLKITICRQKFK